MTWHGSATRCAMHSEHAPRMAVVILNWNGADFTERCLESLFSNTTHPACVVVVDNASRADDVARLRCWMESSAAREGWRWMQLDGDEPPDPSADGLAPWLVLRTLSTQRGFSGGNNAGMRTALALTDPSHLLLLNNDTELAADYFSTMEGVLRAEPDAAIVSGTIRELEDRDMVWYAGGRLIPHRALAVHQVDEPTDDAPRQTDFITGCAMVISRSGLQALGPLPECYFPAYMEDAEYSWRASRMGLRMLYAPVPTVYHYGGGSAGRASRDAWPAYLNVRHRVLFIRRNLRGGVRWFALAYMAITKPVRAVLELARGRPRIGSALVRGLVRGMLDPRGTAGDGRR